VNDSYDVLKLATEMKEGWITEDRYKTHAL